MDSPKANQLYRLEELALQCQAVAEHLAVRDEENRRVQWDLNGRLIRYYTTLGLIDRAQQMVGRTAYYGLRHLLQILAIKKLQTQGLKLETIQRSLLGLTSHQLEDLLELPNNWEVWLAQAQSPPASILPPRSERFWETPAPPSPQASPSRDRPVAPSELVKLNLGPGIDLLIDHDVYRHLDPQALAEWVSLFPHP